MENWDVFYRPTHGERQAPFGHDFQQEFRVKIVGGRAVEVPTSGGNKGVLSSSSSSRLSASDSRALPTVGGVANGNTDTVATANPGNRDTLEVQLQRMDIPAVRTCTLIFNTQMLKLHVWFY